MNTYQKYCRQLLDKFYILEDDYIKLYGVIKKDNIFYKIYMDRFNYLMYGDRLIEKIRGRGYLSYQECQEKYPVELILLDESPQKRNILFRKRK